MATDITVGHLGSVRKHELGLSIIVRGMGARPDPQRTMLGISHMFVEGGWGGVNLAHRIKKGSPTLHCRQGNGCPRPSYIASHPSVEGDGGNLLASVLAGGSDVYITQQFME